MLFSSIRNVFSPNALMGPQGGAMLAIQGELNKLKASPILNPHYNQVQAYLHCLNALIEPLTTTQGPVMGVRSWLIEVQLFIRALQRRLMAGQPLNVHEKAAVQTFVLYWRQMTGPPYFMSKPEAQIVLITLGEFLTR